MKPREPPVLDSHRGSVAAELVGLLKQQYLKSFRVVLVVKQLVHQVVAGILWVSRRELQVLGMCVFVRLVALVQNLLPIF